MSDREPQATELHDLIGDTNDRAIAVSEDAGARAVGSRRSLRSQILRVPELSHAAATSGIERIDLTLEIGRVGHVLRVFGRERDLQRLETAEAAF